MLKGSNVILRAIEPSDIVILHKWENDSSNWTVSGTLTPFSQEIIKQYIATAHLDIYTNKQFRFIITTLNNKPLGTIDLFDFDPYHLRAGVGILIADEEYRKNGYGSEALVLLINYCKTHLQLKQLYCNINSENTASIKLFTKNNFMLAGVKKQWLKQSNTNFVDENLYQLVLH